MLRKAGGIVVSANRLVPDGLGNAENESSNPRYNKKIQNLEIKVPEMVPKHLTNTEKRDSI